MLAQSRGLSANKLVEKLSAYALAVWDTENHFRAMAATGDVHKALGVLDRPFRPWIVREQLLN